MNKHIFTHLVLLITFVTFTSTSFAQEKKGPSLNQSTKHSLGLGAGYSTGYGISYRYFPAKWGVQVNFAPYADNQSSVYSYGLSFLYLLKQKQNTSLYFYQGNHLLHSKEETMAFWNSPSQKIETKKWINSLGFGIEFKLSDDIGLNVMTGFASYSETGLNLTAETAVYYKF